LLEIIPFERQHVADVTRLVNAQIASVPPHWQLSEAQVWDILQKDSLWEVHYQDEEPPPWTWGNEIICVVENNRVFTAARIDHVYDDEQLTTVSTRWIVSDPQYPDALNMLLDYLIAKRGEGKASIIINGRSDFGIDWSGIPTTADHLNNALWTKGFTPFQKWLVMTRNISSLPTINVQLSVHNPDDPLRLEWDKNDSRLEWNLNLYDGENLIGECQSWGIPPGFAACPDYDRWMQIEWLGVDEAYRRRGFGHRLLSTQLHANAWRGKHYCLLYTDTDNTATINLNKRLGFSTESEVWGWMWKPE
jgi:ribosomal protein S18 acetylase RimI-like enzyme